MKHAVIPESFVGLLYENGAFARSLQPGKHKVRRHIFDRTSRLVSLIDMRERSLTIKGQEILTADKVAIRVSMLVYYRVRDPESAAHQVSSYEERIYEDVQLAARRFLSSRTLDAILSDRNEISNAVRDDVRGAAESFGVEIIRADVKDLVFPGNLREIMNRVLETERRAEAMLIETRKEAEALKLRSESQYEAALRSVEAERDRAQITAQADREKHEIRLQTAVNEASEIQKNPALLKLKQLETLREMANSGSRFVIGLDLNDLTSFSLSDDD